MPALLAVAVLLAGCVKGPGDRTPATTPAPTATRVGPTAAPEPCPDGTTLELGIPSLIGDRFAKFTTAGGRVWVTVRSFSHGGIFDPELGRATIQVGHASQPPTYNERSGRTTNVLVETRVVEDTWSAVDLDPGRYWLWPSGGTNVVVRSCQPDGVSDPAPVIVDGPTDPASP